MKHAHPAKSWPTRWFFHNRSEEPAEMQVIDLLTDIRNLLLIALIFAAF